MDETEIVELYESGMSTVQIAKLLNKNPSTIRVILIRNKVELRSNKENSRRFYVNDTKFSEIETEDDAYWLGFMYADGYVLSSEKSKKFGLSISLKDIDHLQKFSNFLESTYPIKTYKQARGYAKGQEYCRIIVTSDSIYDNLIKHGVVKRKSNILTYPSFLRNDLKRHFLRGYIDGDGCITRNNNSYSLKIMCTPEFASGIVKDIEEKFGGIYYSVSKRFDRNTVISLQMFGRTAYSVIKYAYENNAVSLDRKNALAIKSIEYFSRLYQQ